MRHLGKAAVGPKGAIRAQSPETGTFCLLDVALIGLEDSDTAAFDQASVKLP